MTNVIDLAQLCGILAFVCPINLFRKPLFAAFLINKLRREGRVAHADRAAVAAISTIPSRVSIQTTVEVFDFPVAVFNRFIRWFENRAIRNVRDTYLGADTSPARSSFFISGGHAQLLSQPLMTSKSNTSLTTFPQVTGTSGELNFSLKFPFSPC